MKTTREIEHAIELAEESGDVTSRYPGMTYEQGIAEALQWVIGEIDDNDFEYSGRR